MGEFFTTKKYFLIWKLNFFVIFLMNFDAFFNGFWFYPILAEWSTWQWVFLNFSQNFWSFDTPVCASAVIWNRFKQFLLKCSCNSKICTLKLRAEVLSTIQFLSNFQVLLTVYGLTIYIDKYRCLDPVFRLFTGVTKTSENNSINISICFCFFHNIYLLVSCSSTNLALNAPTLLSNHTVKFNDC